MRPTVLPVPPVPPGQGGLPFSVGGDGEEGEYRHVIDTLTGAIRWLRVATVLVLVCAATASLAVMLYLPSLTRNAADKIIESGNSPVLAMFELLRSGAFAATTASILWALFSLGRAALDQATRYQKRLVAAHFLNWVLLRYDSQIRDGSMQVRDAVVFMKMWSETVESAFTHVKFGKAKPEPLKVSAGPGGFEVDTNGAPPKPGTAA